MSFVLAQPLGLLALLALPLIAYLHRHVVQTQRREVSCLALWTDRESVTHEGRLRSHVPDRWVLLLELLAALALALLLAGFDVQSAALDHPRIGVVVDASASMAGGRGERAPLARVRAVLAELARARTGLRFTIVAASELPELLGERELTPAAADALLARFAPRASACRLGAALELMNALGVDEGSTLVFSDDPQLSHARLVRVGAPEANVGIVDASWPAGAQPFVVVHDFGAAEVRGALGVGVDGGRSHASQPLALPPGGEQPIELAVDATTQRIDVHLPGDALDPDNHVTLLRPIERSVAVFATGLDAELQRGVERAIAAVPTLRAGSASDAALVIAENPSALGPLPTLAFLTHGSGASQLADNPIADPFASLLDGFDARDLVWSGFAHTVPDDARVLLRDGSLPLIWQHAGGVFINVDLARSNLLSHAAFPIMVANLADEVDRALGGLPSTNYRQGERLRFQPSKRWNGAVEVHTPAGRVLRFERGATIDLGLLAEAGVYTLQVGAERHAFAVQLTDARESNLMARAPASARPLPALRAAARSDGVPHSTLRTPLLLAVLLLAGAAYALLGRRRPALLVTRAEARTR